MRILTHGQCMLSFIQSWPIDYQFYPTSVVCFEIRVIWMPAYFKRLSKFEPVGENLVDLVLSKDKYAREWNAW